MGLFIWLQRNLYSQSSWGDPPAPAPPPPLPLLASARRFWRHLVPVTLFPSCAVLVTTRAQGAGATLLLSAFFFASTIYAAWPMLQGRARYSFWLLACVLYIGGGLLLALLIVPAANAILGPIEH